MPPTNSRLQRGDLRPARFVARKKQLRNRRVLLIFFFLVFVIGGLGIVANLKGLAIASVVVDGTKVIDNEDVAGFAEDYVSGRYLHIFPKKNIFLYPKQGLYSALIAKFPRTENVSVELRDRHTLHILIKEREGRYLWSGETPATTSSDNTYYFVDGHGYIFAQAPYFSDNVYLKIYGPVPTKSDGPIDSSILDEKQFLKLTTFRDTLSDHGIRPNALYLNPNGDYEFLLEHSGKNGEGAPKILFASTSDFAVMAQNLITALSSEPLKTNFKKKYDSLLYLDLRFNNKVFYKFKPEEETKPQV